MTDIHSTEFTNALHNQIHPHHHHQQLPTIPANLHINTNTNANNATECDTNDTERRSNKNGKFKKIAHKVIEWIRKSLLLGKIEVVYLCFVFFRRVLCFLYLDLWKCLEIARQPLLYNVFAIICFVCIQQ